MQFPIYTPLDDIITFENALGQQNRDKHANYIKILKNEK